MKKLIISSLGIALFLSLSANAGKTKTTPNVNSSLDLIKLVSLGNKNNVEKLLDTGRCDVNHIDEEGETALSCAVYRNDIEIASLLLAHGADPNIGMGRAWLLQAAAYNHNNNMTNLLNSPAPSTTKEQSLLSYPGESSSDTM